MQVSEANEATPGSVTANRADNGQFRFIVVALYPDVDSARTAADSLIQSGIPTADVSIVVSEGKVRRAIEEGDSLVPPAASRGVRHEGEVKGALRGGAAGLALGAELIVLGADAVAALPLLAGMALVGGVVGAVGEATFREMDLNLEETDFRIHLHHGGALVVVYLRDANTSDGVIQLLRATPATEIQRHPLSAPPEH